MKKTRKILAVVLSVLLLVGLFPAASMAKSIDDYLEDFFSIIFDLRTVYSQETRTLYVCLGAPLEDDAGVVLRNGTIIYGPTDSPDFGDHTRLWNQDDADTDWRIGPKIQKVVFLDSFPTPQTYRWFMNLQNMTTVTDMDLVDASLSTNMAGMFYGCKSLQTIDLSELSTQSIQRMDYLFAGCEALKTADLSTFQTENTENMGMMFAGCKSLESVNFTGFDTKNTYNMQGMFAGCEKLTSLDLSDFTVTKFTHMGGMFAGCTALSSLTLGENFRFTALAPYPDPEQQEEEEEEEEEPAEDPGDGPEQSEGKEGDERFSDFDVDYSTPGLPEPPKNDEYTGKWVLVGSDPTVKLTSEELMKYKGSLAGTWEWEREPKSIADAVVTAASQRYSGDELTTTVTVTLNGVPLTEGEDFEISGYENNTDEGEATVTVTGIGEYKGSASGKFTILPLSLNDAIVSVGTETFSGEPVKAKVTVILGNKPLVEDKDFHVLYGDNTNVGTASAVIVGIGNYTGSIPTTFTIAAKNLSAAKVTALDLPYTGTALTPPVTVTLDGVTLINGTDYFVDYINNTEPGATGIAMITGKGNYVGSAYGTFQITTGQQQPGKTDLFSAIVSAPNQIYAGGPATPPVTVKLGDKILTEGTDYTVAYSNNTGVGTATATVTGIGDYKGTVHATFKISTRNLTDDAIKVYVEDQDYSGEELTPPVTVTVNGIPLTEGTDYTVRYLNNTEPGAGLIIVTGKGNYEGMTDVTFEIKTEKPSDKTDITNANVAVDDQDYTGEALTPAVTVTVNGVTLTEGTDYTVAYINNTEPGAGVAVISGIGAYAGTAHGSFKIVKEQPEEKIDLSEKAAVTVKEQTYSGKELKPSVTVTVDGDKLVKDKDYTVEYANNTEPGDGVVIVTGIGKYAGKIYSTFRIKEPKTEPADLEKASFDVGDQLYTGEEVKPAVTVTVDGVPLKEGTDYTVEYGENTEPGEGYVIVTGIGKYSGSTRLTFKIRPKDDANPNAEFLLGDVDGNGKIEAADARYTLRAAVGIDDTKDGIDFSEKITRCFLAADVTKDKNILAEDARLILRVAVGLEALS